MSNIKYINNNSRFLITNHHAANMGILAPYKFTSGIYDNANASLSSFSYMDDYNAIIPNASSMNNAAFYIFDFDNPSAISISCLFSILNFKDEFIEITGDLNNTYKNNISKIFTPAASDVDYFNACVTRLNDPAKKDFIYSYLNKQNLLDAYMGSMSDIEKLGYILCAYLKEANTINQ